MDLVQVNPEFNLYDPEWPLRTYQPQAPPAKFVFAESGRRCGQALDSIISPGCIVSGSRITGSVLCPNVRVHSFCHDRSLHPDARRPGRPPRPDPARDRRPRRLHPARRRDRVRRRRGSPAPHRVRPGHRGGDAATTNRSSARSTPRRSRRSSSPTAPAARATRTGAKAAWSKILTAPERRLAPADRIDRRTSAAERRHEETFRENYARARPGDSGLAGQPDGRGGCRGRGRRSGQGRGAVRRVDRRARGARAARRRQGALPRQGGAAGRWPT